MEKRGKCRKTRGRKHKDLTIPKDNNKKGKPAFFVKILHVQHSSVHLFASVSICL